MHSLSSCSISQKDVNFPSRVPILLGNNSKPVDYQSNHSSSHQKHVCYSNKGDYIDKPKNNEVKFKNKRRSNKSVNWFEVSCYSVKNENRKWNKSSLGYEFNLFALESFNEPRLNKTLKLGRIFRPSYNMTETVTIENVDKENEEIETSISANLEEIPTEVKNEESRIIENNELENKQSGGFEKLYSKYFIHEDFGIQGLVNSNSSLNIGFYQITGKLGSGNFSQVKLATHILTKEQVAIKVLEKTRLDPSAKRLLSREIGVLERLHHPNIVRLYEVIDNLTRLHLVMEYAAGGDLYTRISNYGIFNEVENKFMFSQIIAAVNHLHETKITHRDIKGDNILFALKLPDSINNRSKLSKNLDLQEENELRKKGFTFGKMEYYKVKLADFGFSKSLEDQKQLLTTFCGSPAYAAPELFYAKSYQGLAVDLWALGVLLFFMTTGKLPFNGANFGLLRKSIIAFKEFEAPKCMNKTASELIRAFLSKEPTERIRTDELIKKSQAVSSNSFNEPIWAFYLAGQVFPCPLPRFAIFPSIDMMNLKQTFSIEKEKAARTNSGPKTELTSQNIEHRLPNESPSASDINISNEKKNSFDLAVVARAALMYHRLSLDGNNDKSGISAEDDHRSPPLTSINKQAESEALKMLMKLGISNDELAASQNLQAKSAVTGAYRILLHRLHKIRKLSNITPTQQELLELCERVNGSQDATVEKINEAQKNTNISTDYETSNSNQTQTVTERNPRLTKKERQNMTTEKNSKFCQII